MASSAGIEPATHGLLEGHCSLPRTTRMKLRLIPLTWSPFEGCNGRCSENGGDAGIATGFLKSLNRADSSHACRHSFLADDDLNPFLSSRTARIRHA